MVAMLLSPRVPLTESYPYPFAQPTQIGIYPHGVGEVQNGDASLLALQGGPHVIDQGRFPCTVQPGKGDEHSALPRKTLPGLAVSLGQTRPSRSPDARGQAN